MLDTGTTTMLIPAEHMVRYIAEMLDTEFPFSVLTPEGAVAFQAERQQLYEMCARGVVVATGSHSRIRRIQVCFPDPRCLTPKERRRLRLLLRCPIRSEAAKTTVQESLPDVASRVWAHHTERCGQWPHGGKKS
jgi:hypothetical protein